MCTFNRHPLLIFHQKIVFSFIEVCMFLKLHVEMAYITMPSFLIYLALCLTKTIKIYYKTCIISKKIINKAPTSTYSSFWYVFLCTLVKFHKFQFCVDDMNRCVGGIDHKYVARKPIVLDIWNVQMGTNLKQDEVTFTEKAGFVLNECPPMVPQNLFGVEKFCCNQLTY